MCNQAKPFCTGTIYNFPASTSTTAESGPDYGCLGSQPNPTWYFLKIGTAGNLVIDISQVDGGGTPRDVDFICWGPFNSPVTPCTAGLTAGNTVDCSYSGSATETCNIPSAQVGEYYLLLLTNFSGVPATITFSQTGGTGATDCDIVREVGVNKDIKNNTGQIANDIEIIIEGSYTSVAGHWDGYAANYFSTFTITPVGSNTQLRWSNPNNPVQPGAIAHVGFKIPGSIVKILGVFWTLNGITTGCAHQCVAGTHPYGGTTGGTILYSNECLACEQVPLYTGDTVIEWHATEVPLGDLNPTTPRFPMQIDVLPHAPILLAPGASSSISIPPAPPGATFAVVSHKVSSSPTLTGPDVTHDFLQFQVEEPPAVTPFCSGDGSFTDHTTACPCGNNGAAGNGCGHSFNPSGANLSGTGTLANDDIVLHSQFEPATSFTLFLQHSSAGDSVFHDGVLCASGPLIRLRGRAAVGGEAFFPNSNFAQDSTTTLSIRGGVVVGSGSTRYYSAWFRNASTTFCPPATANVSNGCIIVW